MIRKLLTMLVLSLLFACTSKKSETIKPLLTAKDTITVIASGMTCTGCEQTIQGAIEKVPGVGSVTASHQDGKITVICIKSETDTMAIKNAIIQSGYEVVSVTL